MLWAPSNLPLLWSIKLARGVYPNTPITLMKAAEADPSSGEEELIDWAQPTPTEIAKLNERLALRKLPRQEQLRVRREAMQVEVRKALASKKAIQDKMRKLQIETKSGVVGDPLADIESVFGVFEGNSAYENEPRRVTPIERIKNPFNKAVYDFASRHFPYFAKHYNLLMQKEPTVAFKQSCEFVIYIHEECTSERLIYGIGLRGSVHRSKSLRLLRISR